VRSVCSTDWAFNQLEARSTHRDYTRERGVGVTSTTRRLLVQVRSPDIFRPTQLDEQELAVVWQGSPEELEGQAHIGERKLIIEIE